MNSRMPDELVPFILQDVERLSTSRGELIAHAVAHYYGKPELSPIANVEGDTQMRMAG